MSDDVERFLQEVTPRGAGPELRGQVLDAVGGELAKRPAGRWERRTARAVAASVLITVVLNVWLVTSSNRRRAALYGPAPVPRPIAEVCQAVESVTDVATGRQIQAQLLAAWRSRPARPPQSVCTIDGIEHDSGMIEKGWHDETTPENLEMDRDRGRRPDRHTSDRRHGMGLEVWRTA
jgi:hypothetical protein